MSEKMTLAYVRDRLRSECARVEEDENKYPECAYHTPAWLLGDLADELDAIIESAIAPRVVSMEGLVAMGRVIAANAGEDWDNIGEFAQNIILDTQRAALEAFVENRK